MKTLTKTLLITLLCLLGVGKTSAQTNCFTPQFSFYSTITATPKSLPDGTNYPTPSMVVVQTNTLSGHTVISSVCSTMVTGSVRHWATTTNALTYGTTTYSNPGTSPQVCPSCTINVSTSVTISNYLGDAEISDPDPRYDLQCSLAGRFGGAGGQGMFKYVRALWGMSVPNGTPFNCQTILNPTRENCTIPLKTWCITANPAVNPQDIYDQVSPGGVPGYWIMGDLCYRFTPNNTTPWNCPTINMPSWMLLGLPLPKLPYGLGFHSAPPPYGWLHCDDKYKQ